MNPALWLSRQPGRERIALAIACVALGFGVMAGMLIDWKRQDIGGGVIESPLALGVLFATIAISLICVGLYF